MYLNLSDRQYGSCPSGTQCSSLVSATPSPTIHDAGIAASTTSASPNETTTVVIDTHTAAPKGPIVAGVISGIIVLAIFTAMLWFFCRRRKQLNLLASSSPLVVNRGSNGTEKFAMDYSPDGESQRYSGGGFAPFGGYHKTPSVGAREINYRSFNNSLDVDRIDLTANSLDIDADAPIPDPEKISIVPPPAHEHPAYHQLPGDAPNVPIYEQSPYSAHPASISSSSREAAYTYHPSQSSIRHDSYNQSGPSYRSSPSQSSQRPKSYVQSGPYHHSFSAQSLPKPTYDPNRLSRASYRAELQSPDLKPIKLSIPEESPELPALSFSPIALEGNNDTSPGTVFPYPSPTEIQAPVLSAITAMATSMTTRFPSPRQAGQSIEAIRPTPLTTIEIAEIGSSMSQFQPIPLPDEDIAELSTSPTDFRPTHLSEPHSSPTPPAGTYAEATEYPFETPPLDTSGSELPALTPFRTPSLSRARQLIRCHSSFKESTIELSPHPPLPNHLVLPSPTPPPLKLKKRSLDRPELPTVSTNYSVPKKSTSPKDLPFNYISLPSPLSPSSPSAIKPPPSAMDAIARPESSASTFSIPTGLARSNKRKDTSISVKTDNDALLTHNHSRQWIGSERDHVMSWAIYNGSESPLTEGGEEHNPVVEQIATAQRMRKVSNPQLLRRQEFRQDSGVAGIEEGQLNDKSDHKGPSKTTLKRSSLNQKSRRNSANSAVVRPKSEVSPIFSPVQDGHQFSPLSPEERV